MDARWPVLYDSGPRRLGVLQRAVTPEDKTSKNFVGTYDPATETYFLKDASCKRLLALSVKRIYGKPSNRELAVTLQVACGDEPPRECTFAYVEVMDSKW
jgi:hypothetical protein